MALAAPPSLPAYLNLAHAIELMFLRARATIKLDELRATIEEADETAAERAARPSWEPMPTLVAALEQRIEEAARSESHRVARSPLQKAIIDPIETPTVQATTAFNLISPGALAAARWEIGQLIQGIDQQSLEAVRVIVAQAFQEGGHPSEQAIRIRNVVGLNVAQAQALFRFAQKNTPKATEAYRQRLLRLRSKTIARTETIRASEIGRDVAWQVAVQSGQLDPRRVQQEWVNTKDARTDPSICVPLGGQKQPLGSPFVTAEGRWVVHPPAHPNCRCTRRLVFTEAPSLQIVPSFEDELSSSNVQPSPPIDVPPIQVVPTAPMPATLQPFIGQEAKTPFWKLWWSRLTGRSTFRKASGDWYLVEPRDPKTGKWMHEGGVVVAAIKKIKGQYPPWTALSQHQRDAMVLKAGGLDKAQEIYNTLASKATASGMGGYQASQAKHGVKATKGIDEVIKGKVKLFAKPEPKKEPSLPLSAHQTPLTDPKYIAPSPQMLHLYQPETWPEWAALSSTDKYKIGGSDPLAASIYTSMREKGTETADAIWGEAKVNAVYNAVAALHPKTNLLADASKPGPTVEGFKAALLAEHPNAVATPESMKWAFHQAHESWKKGDPGSILIGGPPMAKYFDQFGKPNLPSKPDTVSEPIEAVEGYQSDDEINEALSPVATYETPKLLFSVHVPATWPTWSSLTPQQRSVITAKNPMAAGGVYETLRQQGNDKVFETYGSNVNLVGVYDAMKSIFGEQEKYGPEADELPTPPLPPTSAKFAFSNWLPWGDLTQEQQDVLLHIDPNADSIYAFLKKNGVADAQQYWSASSIEAIRQAISPPDRFTIDQAPPVDETPKPLNISGLLPVKKVGAVYPPWESLSPPHQAAMIQSVKDTAPSPDTVKPEAVQEIYHTIAHTKTNQSGFGGYQLAMQQYGSKPSLAVNNVIKGKYLQDTGTLPTKTPKTTSLPDVHVLPTVPEPILPAVPNQIPDSLQTILSWPKVSGPAGSQGGTWHEAPNGQRFFVKPSPSPAHAYNEVATLQIYQQLGGLQAGRDLPYTKALLGPNSEKMYVVSQEIPHLEKKSSAWWQSPAAAATREKAKRFFAPAAVLMHFDVAGLEHDNLLVEASTGNPVLVEGGGGMAFRAQGSPKPGWNTASKLTDAIKGLLGTGTTPNAQTKAIFGGMTPQEVNQSMTALKDRWDASHGVYGLSWHVSGMPHEQELTNKNVLQSRIDSISAKTIATPTPAKAPIDVLPGVVVDAVTTGPPPKSTLVDWKGLTDKVLEHAVHGWSFAWDAKGVEDHQVRVQKQRLLDGTTGYFVHFKLTPEGQKALKKQDGWSTQSGLLVPRNHITDTHLQETEDFAYAALNLKGGNTLSQDTPWGRIRVLDHKGSRPVHGRVSAFIRDDQWSEATLKDLTDRLGVKDAHAPTPQDHLAMAEARLLYVLAPAGAQQPGAEERKNALDKIQKDWGITPSDVVVEHSPTGEVQYMMPQTTADKIVEKTAVKYFHHNASSTKRILSVLFGPHQALLSTQARFAEGVGGRGMSSDADMTTGGGDYAFLHQSGKKTGSQSALVFKASTLLRRLDWFAQPGDTYGGTHSAGYKNRNNIDGLIAGAGYANSAETMMKRGISMHDVDTVQMDQSSVNEAVAELEKRGWKSWLDGRSLRDVIIDPSVQKTMNTTYKPTPMGDIVSPLAGKEFSVQSTLGEVAQANPSLSTNYSHTVTLKDPPTVYPTGWKWVKLTSYAEPPTWGLVPEHPNSKVKPLATEYTSKIPSHPYTGKVFSVLTPGGLYGSAHPVMNKDYSHSVVMNGKPINNETGSEASLKGWDWKPLTNPGQGGLQKWGLFPPAEAVPPLKAADLPTHSLSGQTFMVHTAKDSEAKAFPTSVEGKEATGTALKYSHVTQLQPTDKPSTTPMGWQWEHIGGGMWGLKPAEKVQSQAPHQGESFKVGSLSGDLITAHPAVNQPYSHLAWNETAPAAPHGYEWKAVKGEGTWGLFPKPAAEPIPVPGSVMHKVLLGKPFQVETATGGEAAHPVAEGVASDYTHVVLSADPPTTVIEGTQWKLVSPGTWGLYTTAKWESKIGQSFQIELSDGTYGTAMPMPSNATSSHRFTTFSDAKPTHPPAGSTWLQTQTKMGDKPSIWNLYPK